jgi:hypothetical protein
MIMLNIVKSDLYAGWDHDDHGLIKTINGAVYHVADAGSGYRASVQRIRGRGTARSTPLGKYPTMDEAVQACDGHAGVPPAQGPVMEHGRKYGLPSNVVRQVVDGRTYHYYRKRGYKGIRLIGTPGSATFEASYQAASAAPREPLERRKSSKSAPSKSAPLKSAPTPQAPREKPARAPVGLSLLRIVLHDISCIHPDAGPDELHRLYAERLQSNDRLLAEAITRCFAEDYTELHHP